MSEDPATPYAAELGQRLREIRQQQGLSLHGVQAKSGDRWKAVVIGSYERGDRAITAHRLAELADFYGVPLTRLLPGSRVQREDGPTRRRLVIDLETLHRLPIERAAPLIRYAATIQDQRGDYNGRVLSIREDDVRALSAVYDASPSGLLTLLDSWGVLANREAYEPRTAEQRFSPDRASVSSVDLLGRETGQRVINQAG